MPKSKVRKKRVSHPPPGRVAATQAPEPTPSSRLYVGVMVGLMLLGLAWLVVNYLASTEIEFLAALGAWNFLIGFALMIGGLLMTMRWR